MNINLNYKRTEQQKNEDKMSDSELTAHYLDLAASTAYREGLGGQQLRIFGRIQRKVDAAIEQGEDEVTLEEAEKDFLRKTFEKCKVPAAISKFFMVLEDEVEGLKKLAAPESAGG
jgi:hypothetical protein